MSDIGETLPVILNMQTCIKAKYEKGSELMLSDAKYAIISYIMTIISYIMTIISYTMTISLILMR